MEKSIDIVVPADPDQDDCLYAAAAEVSRALRLGGRDLQPRWTDDDRESVTVTVPCPAHNDVRGWERLRALDGYSGSYC